MTNNEHQLFVQYDVDAGFTEEQLQEILSDIDDVLPENVGVTIVPESMAFLTAEQVREFADEMNRVAESLEE